MDIKNLILKRLSAKNELKVADIVKATGFSRAYVKRFFQQLTKEGKIILVGKANQAKYVLVKKGSVQKIKREMLFFHRILNNINLSEDVVFDEIKDKTGIFFGVSKNVSRVVDYAFTEMLNNAIEHSKSKKIEVWVERNNEDMRFRVVDRGVGIFKNIMRKRGLRNEMEAIQDLLKGKQTTFPKRHTGEGIFFTSKVADIFEIKGSKKKLTFDNKLGDVFISDIRPIIGTEVEFLVSKNSKRKLDEIFKKYTGEAFEFSKTEVSVKLYKMGSEYISRSQARRIVSGLDKFKTVVLDFKNVKTVGQSFADEVFRVWQKSHPKIKIISKNANENIEFAIKRAKATEL